MHRRPSHSATRLVARRRLMVTTQLVLGAPGEPGEQKYGLQTVAGGPASGPVQPDPCPGPGPARVAMGDPGPARRQVWTSLRRVGAEQVAVLLGRDPEVSAPACSVSLKSASGASER